jgi:hypothetical protein
MMGDIVFAPASGPTTILGGVFYDAAKEPGERATAVVWDATSGETEVVDYVVPSEDEEPS